MDIRNKRKACDVTQKNKRMLKMLRHPAKSGKHFPLTHSDRKSLNKYRRCLTIYGLGKTLAAVLTAVTRRYRLNKKGRELRPRVEMSTPKKVSGGMVDNRNPNTSYRTLRKLRRPLDQHPSPAAWHFPGRAWEIPV